MAKTIRLFMLILCGCWIYSTAFGQVVNIESKRLDRNKEGLAGTIDLSFSFTHTTNDVFQTGNKIQVQYRRKRSKVLMLSDLTIIRANSTDLINNGFQHLRYNYLVNRWLTWEVFGQLQYNQVQKLNLRALAGTGPRFRLIENDTTALYLGTLYMYEYEELSDELPLQRNHRLSSYLSFDFDLTDKISLDHITYYQPQLNDFGDFRISSETVLTFKLTKKLTLGLKGNYIYDSQPPPDVPSNTYEFKNTLGYKF